MSDRNDPKNEGHTREWQDRARVVLDAKKDAKTEASPNQSPMQSEHSEDADARSERLYERGRTKDDEPVY